MRLFEQKQQYLSFLDMVTEPGSDFDEKMVADTLEGMEGVIEDKVVNIAAVVKNMEAEADSIGEAMDGMAKRKKSLESRAKWLREYALDAMKSTGIEKVSCPWFKVSVAKNPVSVVVDTEVERLPPFYIREKLFREPDKAAIKADLEAGKPVAGCRLEQGYRLSIR